MKAMIYYGENIRTLRHEKGLRQVDIATKLGISVAAFSKIESGITDINLSRLEQIAEIFEISVAEILTCHEEDLKIKSKLLLLTESRIESQKEEILNLQRKIIELFDELHMV